MYNFRTLFRQGFLDAPRNSSVLWNAMIYPFLNMTIYGTIWYQGEDNAELYTHSYNCTFPAMIDDWRAKWYESTQTHTGNDFPFGFVQVCCTGYPRASISNVVPIKPSTVTPVTFSNFWQIQQLFQLIATSSMICVSEKLHRLLLVYCRNQVI